MRILLAEDDAELADGLLYALRQAGHAADRVGDGARADAALADGLYDLLVLDLGLPGMDGYEVLRRLRARGQETMVLVVTARDETAQRIRGLDLGADDYLTKPFSIDELQARVRALGRRMRKEELRPIACGPLALDLHGNRILLDGAPLELTQREFGVLACLIESSGRVVSKERLFERLYDWDAQANLNAVEVFVSRVRKKIEPAGVTLRVVRGLGYLLEPPHDAR